MDLETCCDIGLPQAVATFLPDLFVQNTQQLIAALNIANDNQISDAGEAVATGLRQRLPGITGSYFAVKLPWLWPDTVTSSRAPMLLCAN